MANAIQTTVGAMAILCRTAAEDVSRIGLLIPGFRPCGLRRIDGSVGHSQSGRCRELALSV
jgi:hypothetical protein